MPKNKIWLFSISDSFCLIASHTDVILMNLALLNICWFCPIYHSKESMIVKTLQDKQRKTLPISSSWLLKYEKKCANYILFDFTLLQTFPKPWTVTAFVTMLLRLIKIADYGTKTPILHAIMLLHCQDPLNNIRVVVDIVMSILTKSNPPTCQEEDQKVWD